MLFKDRMKVIDDYHKWAKVIKLIHGINIPANFQSFMAYLDSRGLLVNPSKHYTIEEFKKWLDLLAIDNAGEGFTEGISCVIDNLDGFERFTAEKREEKAIDESKRRQSYESSTVEEEVQKDSREEPEPLGR